MPAAASSLLLTLFLIPPQTTLSLLLSTRSPASQPRRHSLDSNSLPANAFPFLFSSSQAANLTETRTLSLLRHHKLLHCRQPHSKFISNPDHSLLLTYLWFTSVLDNNIKNVERILSLGLISGPQVDLLAEKAPGFGAVGRFRGWTALAIACLQGNDMMCRLLLKHKGDAGRLQGVA